MPEKDDLDRLLDSALSTYADPGPESGLEERVLATLSAAQSSGERRRWFEAPRGRWLPWAIAVPIAAGVMVLWMSIGRTVHAPSTQPQFVQQPDRTQKPSLSARVGSQGPAITTRPAGAKAHSNSPEVSARLKSCPVTKPACGLTADTVAGAAVPKLDVFPAPQPLTGEERALVAAATSRSIAEREALAEAKGHMDAPLSIADLNIPPLASSDESKK